MCDRLRGYPLLFNWVEGGRTLPLTYERIEQLGFKLIICPLSTLLAATAAMREALHEIRVAGTPANMVDRVLPFSEFLDVIGLPEINELEQRFASS